MLEPKSRIAIGLVSVLLACAWVDTARADRVLLKNGKQYEGTIVKENDKYVHIQTAERKRVFRQTEIREIIRDAAAQQQEAAPRAFSELGPVARQIRNARAEYELERYPNIITRLKPIVTTNDNAPEMSEARWLLIEAYERLGDFDQATRLLEGVAKSGTTNDRVRARAHLDIFAQNPGYKLEMVNDVLSRDFLPRDLAVEDDKRLDLYVEGKQPGALANRELMRRALQEYVDQILGSEEAGLQAFKDSLDLDETVERIRSIPPAGKIQKHLPYGELLDDVQESFERVEAILPGYADGYLLDLVRTEAEHLSEAVEVIFRELVDKYPERLSYPYDPANGKLTKQGREQWRENCETFLTESKPLTLIVEYQRNKVSAYPRELRRLGRQFRDTLNRLKQMREAINRKKDSRIYV